MVYYCNDIIDTESVKQVRYFPIRRMGCFSLHEKSRLIYSHGKELISTVKFMNVISNFIVDIKIETLWEKPKSIRFTEITRQENVSFVSA